VPAQPEDRRTRGGRGAARARRADQGATAGLILIRDKGFAGLGTREPAARGSQLSRFTGREPVMVFSGLIIIAVVLMVLLVLGVAQCQPQGRTGERPDTEAVT